MKVARLVGLSLVVAGGALLYFGVTATESPLEALSQTLTGRYSDQTMICLISGSVSAVIGLAMLFKSS
jgi:hypothetical protein